MSKKKKVHKFIKLQIQAGKANPAPPIGPALGAAGLNIMGFCKEFNARTQDKVGFILPVVISVYADKTFTFITKQPPISSLIKKELGIKTASAVPNREKVGVLNKEQMMKILEMKRPDLRINSDEAAFALISGTARSMGVDVDWDNG
jgi:large subunit ribosomal protein L11